MSENWKAEIQSIFDSQDRDRARREAEEQGAQKKREERVRVIAGVIDGVIVPAMNEIAEEVRLHKDRNVTVEGTDQAAVFDLREGTRSLLVFSVLVEETHMAVSIIQAGVGEAGHRNVDKALKQITKDDVRGWLVVAIKDAVLASST